MLDKIFKPRKNVYGILKILENHKETTNARPCMYCACIKHATRTLHIRKSNSIHFSISVLVVGRQRSCMRARSTTVGARQARFLDKAHQRLSPRPAWKLFPSPCFAFSFQHAKQRRPGRRRHHRATDRFIQTRQTNTSK